MHANIERAGGEPLYRPATFFGNQQAAPEMDPAVSIDFWLPGPQRIGVDSTRWAVPGSRLLEANRTTGL
jgi:hypothetical protein